MYPTNSISSSLSSSASSSLVSITTTISSTASTSVTNTTSAKKLSSQRYYHTKTNQAEYEHRKILNNLTQNVHSFILNLSNSTATKTVSNQNEVINAIPTSTLLSSKTDFESLGVAQTQNDLLRIHECIERIFLNGLRVYKPDKSTDCWRFIEALNWISPHMTISIANLNSQQTASVHLLPPKSRIRNDKTLLWIYENLQTCQLSKKLKCLLSDSEHLVNCYEVTTAYFHSKKYVNALFICLNAFETKQKDLLSQIDRNLYSIESNSECMKKKENLHKSNEPVLCIEQSKLVINSQNKELVSLKTSSSSISNNSSDKLAISQQNKEMGNKNSMQLYCDSSDISRRSSLVPTTNDIINYGKMCVSPSKLLITSQLVYSNAKTQSTVGRKISNRRLRKHSNRLKSKTKYTINIKLRPWVSLPDLNRLEAHHKKLTKSKSQPARINNNRVRLTAMNLAIKERQQVPSIQLKTPKVQANTETAEPSSSFGDDSELLQPINLVKCDDIKIHFDHRHAPHNRNDQPAEPLVLPTFTQPTSENNESPPPVEKSNRQLAGILKCLPSKKNIFPFLGSSATSTSMNNESGSSSYKLSAHSAPADFVTTFLPRNGEKIENRYGNRILEEVVSDGSAESPIMAQNGVIQPTLGQSLTSYLQASQMSSCKVTDLERENAHFNLSDAIISAIEEIKYENTERLKKKQMKANESENRRRNRRPKRLKSWAENLDGGNDEDFRMSDLDMSTSITSASTISSRSSSNSDLSHVSITSDTSDTSNSGDLKRLKLFSVSSHSINDHQAYAEWADGHTGSLSAEGIALSLISRFKDKQLPRAADLLWNNNDQQYYAMSRVYDLVPEQNYQLPYTRGTSDWAPPRAQIIFTRHSTPDRKKILQAQNYRCAGCGMKVATSLSHCFRYCEYLGKYHCTGCHRNQISTIPARVLDRWDFSYHPVSVFAYRLLDQIWKVPLFHVPDLSKELYSKVRALRTGQMRRKRIKFVNDFIKTCRFADDLKREFECLPRYIIEDVDLWSMSDFVAIRNGTFLKDVNDLILRSEQHVYNCELCTAHGFICEYCTDKQVIFPWQLKVHRCDKCGSCCHSACWKNECLKCQRLEKRKKNENVQN